MAARSQLSFLDLPQPSSRAQPRRPRGTRPGAWRGGTWSLGAGILDLPQVPGVGAGTAARQREEEGHAGRQPEGSRCWTGPCQPAAPPQQGGGSPVNSRGRTSPRAHRRSWKSSVLQRCPLPALDPLSGSGKQHIPTACSGLGRPHAWGQSHCVLLVNDLSDSPQSPGRRPPQTVGLGEACNPTAGRPGGPTLKAGSEYRREARGRRARGTSGEQGGSWRPGGSAQGCQQQQEGPGRGQWGQGSGRWHSRGRAEPATSPSPRRSEQSSSTSAAHQLKMTR